MASISHKGHRRKTVNIAPSILSADFSRFGEEANRKILETKGNHPTLGCVVRLARSDAAGALAGTTPITDADLSKVTDEAVHKKHPGLKRAQGHIGFLGHGSHVEFRNIRVKEL